MHRLMTLDLLMQQYDSKWNKIMISYQLMSEEYFHLAKYILILKHMLFKVRNFFIDMYLSNGQVQSIHIYMIYL